MATEEQSAPLRSGSSEGVQALHQDDRETPVAHVRHLTLFSLLRHHISNLQFSGRKYDLGSKSKESAAQSKSVPSYCSREHAH